MKTLNCIFVIAAIVVGIMLIACTVKAYTTHIWDPIAEEWVLVHCSGNFDIRPEPEPWTPIHVLPADWNPLENDIGGMAQLE